MESDVFAFVDWGEDELELGYFVGFGDEMTGARYQRTGEGIEKLQRFLVEAGGRCASRVHVAIERSHGAVVDAMLDSGFNTYSVNPRQIARFRGRYRNSNARDDRYDCFVGARALRTDRDCFRRMNSLNPLNAELRGWEREHGRLVTAKTRVAQQIRQQLLTYYPQILELTSLETMWLFQVWKLAPTPEAAAASKEEAIAKVTRRSRLTASEILQILREKPLKVSEGTVRAAVGRIGLLFEQLQLLLLQVRGVDGELKRLLQAIETEQLLSTPELHSDVAIVQSLPGAGIGFVTTVLGEAPEQIHERDHQNLRSVSGVAPVTDASGKQQNRYKKRREPKVMIRRACNPRLRDAMYHLGRNAPLHDPYYKEQYANMRARGHTHGRACRQIADNMLTVLFAMLRTGTLYEPTCRKTRQEVKKATV